MEKQLRNITRIQMVLAMIAEVILENSCKDYFALWFFMSGHWIYTIRFTMLLYWDIKEIYPPEKLILPSQFEKIFENLYGSKRIPKSFVKHMVAMGGMFVVSTIIIIYLYVNKMDKYLWQVSFLLIFTAWGIFWYTYRSTYMTIFIERFKKLNKYNVRYAFLFTQKRMRKWPLSKSLGKCNILEHKIQNKKVYATVKMINREESFKDVLVLPVIAENERKSYKLREICNVKYVTS